MLRDTPRQLLGLARHAVPTRPPATRFSRLSLAPTRLKKTYLTYLRYSLLRAYTRHRPIRTTYPALLPSSSPARRLCLASAVSFSYSWGSSSWSSRKVAPAVLFPSFSSPVPASRPRLCPPLCASPATCPADSQIRTIRQGRHWPFPVDHERTSGQCPCGRARR